MCNEDRKSLWNNDRIPNGTFSALDSGSDPLLLNLDIVCLDREYDERMGRRQCGDAGSGKQARVFIHLD